MSLLDFNVKTKARFYDHGKAGKVYTFSWVRKRNDVVYPSIIDLSVSAQTGKITDYLFIDDPVVLHSLIPKLTKEQAVAKAVLNMQTTPKLRLQMGWNLEETALSISRLFPKQTLHWHVVLRGDQLQPYRPESGQILLKKLEEFLIDTSNGDIIWVHISDVKPLSIVQIRPPVPRPVRLTAVTMWPVWSQTDDSPLLFTHWHELEPGYVRDDVNSFFANFQSNKGLISTVDNGQETALMWTPQRIGSLTWTSDRNRIAFEEWYGVLDFRALIF